MSYVIQADEKLVEKIVRYYFVYSVEPPSSYIDFYFKTSSCTISIYSSMKVMFQGKDAEFEHSKWNNNKILDKSKKAKSNQNEIGSDEVGTGDFFGPIVVCASFIDEKSKTLLESLNIKDSKKLTDKQIVEIAKKIKKDIVHEILILDNPGYNMLIKKGNNMNAIKAMMHNQALLALQKNNPSDLIIVDQFTTPKSYFSYLINEKEVLKNIHFETKAEDKYLSVAVSSILARYYFLMLFQKLEQEIGFTLLKGASNEVDKLAAKIIKEKGETFLKTIAKANFKTLEKAKNIVKDM